MVNLWKNKIRIHSFLDNNNRVRSCIISEYFCSNKFKVWIFSFEFCYRLSISQGYLLSRSNYYFKRVFTVYSTTKMVKIIALESQLEIFRNYNISCNGRLKNSIDSIFLRISKNLKVKKETIHKTLKRIGIFFGIAVDASFASWFSWAIHRERNWHVSLKWKRVQKKTIDNRPIMVTKRMDRQLFLIKM